MPQISPLSWLFIPTFFLIFLFFVMVGIWWLFVGEYSFSSDGDISGENFENSNDSLEVFFWRW